MRRTEGKGIVLSCQEQRVTSARAFTAFPSALFVLTFPCDCWSSLSPPPPAPHPPSSPLAWAVVLYLRHSGIKLRDSKVFPGLSTEKEKWLAFLKTKKV